MKSLIKKYEELPQYLKANARFCVWKQEEGKGKVPYQVNGKRAKSNKVNTFTDFKKALDIVDKFYGLGIGIFNKISTIDIDNCIDASGNYSDLAKDIMEILKDSYIEKSPSGKGIRIIFLINGFSYEKDKYYINNQKLGLEVYVADSTNKIVQKIRESKRRPSRLGEMGILYGMIFRADCGKKLYQARGKTIPKEKEHFVCSTYRKVKGGCSSHQIRNIIVEELLLEDLQKIVAFAKNHESEFVKLVMNKTEKNLVKEKRQNQKELGEAVNRISALDTIIGMLYEDHVFGKLT